ARREDRRLLLGRSRFIADIHLPVCMLRSCAVPLRMPASARSRSRARSRRLAWSPSSLAPTSARIWSPFPACRIDRPKISIPDQPIIATDKVCYVGEAVAVVVAADRYLAEDAAALVELQMEPLAPIVGIDAALDPAAPPIHDALSTNIIARLHMRKGDADAILASGARVLRHRFDNHRYAGMPIECRGVVAQYDPATDSMTVWSATRALGAARGGRPSRPPRGTRAVHRAGRWRRFRSHGACLSRGCTSTTLADFSRALDSQTVTHGWSAFRRGRPWSAGRRIGE